MTTVQERAPAGAATTGSLPAVLAIGFGTTVAMWAVGYVTHLPPQIVPAPAVLVLMIACLLAGGWVSGRYAGGGWRRGLLVGLLVGALNLLILGSVLGGGGEGGGVPPALVWVPGSFLVGGLLGAAGAAAGSRGAGETAAPDWTASFARVAATATFLLLIVGGLVTSQQAGLAVVDWPNTFGYNMFLYPLAKMTGGIYYEHAHRLFGSLVGLTTLVLAGVLLFTERRKGVKALGLLALALVIVQGILGGLRVTGGFTLTTSPEQVSPRLALAVVHGVLGQVVLATLVTLAAVTTPRWKTVEPEATRRAGTERFLAMAFLVALVIQLFLGALLRHYSWGVLVHVSMATLVAGLGLGVGVRHWGYGHGRPVLPRLGKLLLVIVPVQLTLGVAALVAVTIVPEGAAPSAADVILTTSHQATGAILLSAAVLAALWTYRILRPSAAVETDRVEGEAS